ncbi:hypothetical protein [Terricaulis sp.]|uniref:hypothetical protein n=1 Tax=Terricaulis sp. TaxID=2768686 RepID=UPI0037848442
MLWFVLAGFIGVVLVRVVLRTQTRIQDEEGDRRERQRARLLGLEKIPGADGKYQPRSEEP